MNSYQRHSSVCLSLLMEARVELSRHTQFLSKRYLTCRMSTIVLVPEQNMPFQIWQYFLTYKFLNLYTTDAAFKLALQLCYA